MARGGAMRRPATPTIIAPIVYIPARLGARSRSRRRPSPRRRGKAKLRRACTSNPSFIRCDGGAGAVGGGGGLQDAPAAAHPPPGAALGRLLRVQAAAAAGAVDAGVVPVQAPAEGVPGLA
eukprot:3132056-Pyramimonas_sp.AAC.1